MPLDYEQLINWQVPETACTWTKKDTMLYALATGFGTEQQMHEEIQFVYERDLIASPAMGSILAHPGFWIKDPRLAINWKRVVHAGHSLELYSPLPVEGDFVGVTTIKDVIDRGHGKGAFILQEREVIDSSTGNALCRMENLIFCRDDGGFGGPVKHLPSLHKIPSRSPDTVCTLSIPSQSALLFRLASGDLNPLHVDPEVAGHAGFSQPILHGLCSLGIAIRAILRNVCRYQTTGIRSFCTRFAGPIFPGERLDTEIWHDGSEVSFRAKIAGGDQLVLDNGLLELNQ